MFVVFRMADDGAAAALSARLAMARMLAIFMLNSNRFYYRKGF